MWLSTACSACASSRLWILCLKVTCLKCLAILTNTHRRFKKRKNTLAAALDCSLLASSHDMHYFLAYTPRRGIIILMRAMPNVLFTAIVVLAGAGVASAFLPAALSSQKTSSVGSFQNNHHLSSLVLSMETSKRTTSEELIPREILFGNPENTSPSLSPDGNHLAYLAPSPDGVMNIFIKSNFSSSDKNDDAEEFVPGRMITNSLKRAIRSLAWAYDSSTIFFMQDDDGDENFHLFAVDNAIAENEDDEDIIPTARDLTPGKDVKAQNIFTNYRYPDQILVGTNQRNPKVFDMYRCYYKTGELILDTINPGDVIGWKVEDESFEVRAATVRNSADSSTTVRIRSKAGSIDNDNCENGSEEDTEWRDVFHYPYGEEGGLINFCPDDGKTGYITSSLGRETTALLKVDMTTGETIEEIYSNEKANVGGITLQRDTKELRAVTYNYARTERVFYDDELKKDYDFLMSTAPDSETEIGVASRSLDEMKWVVSYFSSSGPTSYVIYDKLQQTVTPLFVSNPKLLPYKFAPMEIVEIPARDGLPLVGYLTRAVEKGGPPTPLILLVHGGPWARDYWGFNPRAQWFANRGYATLQVNFRGSTGYGKTFLHKGDKQWGVGDMQHDLTDSVEYAIREGIADKDKICSKSFTVSK